MTIFLVLSQNNDKSLLHWTLEMYCTYSSSLLSSSLPHSSLPCLGLSWPVSACLCSLFQAQLGFKNPLKSCLVLSCLVLVCLGLSWPVLAPLCSPKLGFQNHQNHCFSWGKTWFFEKIAFRDWHRFPGGFWRHLGSILGRKIHQNPPKSRSPKASKFWSIFGSIFGRLGVRFRPPRRAQDGPKRPPRPPRRPQEAAKTAQEAAKMAPRGSQKTDCHPHFSVLAAKCLQRPPGTPPRLIFWQIFDLFFDGFSVSSWSIFGWFLLDFWFTFW